MEIELKDSAPNSSQLSENSLLEWYAGLRGGRQLATERLWNLYFQRMVEVARHKLRGVNRAAYDEEDVALSAFKSFCRGLQGGQIQIAVEARSLWPLLVSMTVRKAIDHLRHEGRLKRGGSGGKTSQDPLGDANGGNVPVHAKREQMISWEQVADVEPSPEMVAIASDFFQRLLGTLEQTGDASLPEIAVASLNGYDNSEIAHSLGCTVRTVQRKLKTIRKLWEGLSS